MLELSIVTSQTVSAVGRYCLYPDAAMHDFIEQKE